MTNRFVLFERATRLELAISCLEGKRSTTELRPRELLFYRVEFGRSTRHLTIFATKARSSAAASS